MRGGVPSRICVGGKVAVSFSPVLPCGDRRADLDNRRIERPGIPVRTGGGENHIS